MSAKLYNSCKALLAQVEYYLGPCLAGSEMTDAREAIAEYESNQQKIAEDAKVKESD